jgi:histidine triad (HIT) family protein
VSECLFCGIIQGSIPSDKVYEDDQVYAFKDINPEAPVHILIVPKEHLESVDSIDGSREALAGHIVRVAADIARDQGVDKTGYRLVSNCGERAGQSVRHLHFHLLGGRSFGWPPG